MPFVSHPLVKENTIEARLYQEVLVSRITEKGNTLVVAPTALGKTVVAVMLAAHTLKETPDSKILFVAPTKPLAVQHEKSFKKFLQIGEEKIVSITGTTKPSERKKIYKEAVSINATPQTIENDLLNGNLRLEEFGLVIFDECLKGDSKILLNEESEKPIKDLVEDIFSGKNVFVKSYDASKQCIVTKKILGAQKIPNTKRMIKIETTCGKKLTATEDHLFFIKRNNENAWVRAGDLCVTDFLASHAKSQNRTDNRILVSENDIIKLYSKEQRKNIENYRKTLGLQKKYGYGQRKISKKLRYSERQIGNWLYLGVKPKPIKTVDAMKQLGLIPLTYNSPHINTIAKILGHIFGDGWISESKKANFYTIGFSGKANDLQRIQEDLKTMGISYSNIKTRKTSSIINGKKVKGTTNSFVCTDHRFTRLLVLLGAPVGEKKKQKTPIPKWIFSSSAETKRAFLSSLFGSEADCLLAKKDCRTFYAPRMCLSKTTNLGEAGMNFLKGIKKLLNELGVKVSKIYTLSGNINKDGTKTRKFVLQISNSNANLANFCKNVSYTYCLEKEIISSKASEYLHQKKQNISNRNILQDAALLLKKDGFNNRKIAKTLNLPLHQIERWAHNTNKTNRLQTAFPPFSEHPCTGDAIIQWKKISQIKETKKEKYVYDLTVEGTHNFIANSLIVHNCHRAVGDYAYVFIAMQLQKQNPKALVLALTASPGSEEEKIQDICRNLFIKNIEVKGPEDSDVKDYVNEIEIDWVKVDLPHEFVAIKQLLENFMKKQLILLKKLGVAKTENKRYYNRARILEMQHQIRQRLMRHGRTQPSLYSAASACAALLKIAHAEELIETQGISALKNYFEKMGEEARRGQSKAAKQIMANEGIGQAAEITKKLFEKNVQHPKYKELKRIVLAQIEANPNSKIIVFNHYRDSIKEVTGFLNSEEKIKATKFIGQAAKGNEKGMSQKEQQEILGDLRDGKHNVLVSSSVGEEGLDIPDVEMVVFFEPVPSEIRTIQRRGRTGRFGKGKMVVLMAKGTRDEAFYWAARGKERKMKQTLHNMGAETAYGQETRHLSEQKKIIEQTTLDSYMEKKNEIIVFADTREGPSTVIRELTEKGVIVRTKQLDVGDYVLSREVCVERKTVEDFIKSMIDGRLFSQLVDLRSGYEKPLLIVEGEMEELFTLRNIHRNAIMGALTSIALDYQVPIINTHDARETAEYVYVIAKREQLGKEKEIGLRFGRKGLTLEEQQRFVVEGIPMVGPQLAKNLLKEFGSIRKIANADEKQLQKVENLGEKKAKRIFKVFNRKFNEKD